MSPCLQTISALVNRHPLSSNDIIEIEKALEQVNNYREDIISQKFMTLCYIDVLRGYEQLFKEHDRDEPALLKARKSLESNVELFDKQIKDVFNLVKNVKIFLSTIQK